LCDFGEQTNTKLVHCSQANLNLINQQQSNQPQTQQQQQQPQTQQTVMLGNQLVKVQTINQIQQQSQQTIRQQQVRDSIGNLSTGTVLLGNTGQTIKVHNPQVSLANSGQQLLIGNQIKVSDCDLSPKACQCN
jgi:hypothetical protein